MKIRKAKKEDLKEIAEIFRIESAKKPYNTKFTSVSVFKDILELSKKDLYVAINEEKIIGFIASHVIISDKSQSYIDELWIKSDYQKKGIGGMLLDFVENIYIGKNVKKIRLVARRKTVAYGFYKKLKYRDHKDLVFMEKKL
jgi:aminoglycoside 6'-N-acetyltransferase I